MVMVSTTGDTLRIAPKTSESRSEHKLGTCLVFILDILFGFVHPDGISCALAGTSSCIADWLAAYSSWLVSWSSEMDVGFNK